MKELKIKLTQIEENDAKSIAALFENGFERFIDEVEDIGIYDLDSWFKSIVEDPSRVTFAIRASKVRDKDFGYIVGICGLWDIDWLARHARLFFVMIDRDGHRATMQNYPATQYAVNNIIDMAFNTLNLNKIWIEVYEHNDIKETLEYFGFVAEGIRRDTLYVSGKPLNSIVCSMLKQEYESWSK